MAVTQAHRTTAASTDLRVGSFNITSVHIDSRASGQQRVWRERRPVVIADILRERLDVLGVQEAYEGNGYASGLVQGTNQIQDLKLGLNSAGGTFAVVDEDPASSRQTRIFYNSSTVTPISNGVYTYRTQPPGPHDTRYLVWAVFAVNATGERFYFSTTHLMNDDPSGQRAQWQEMIDVIRSTSGGLPVIATGDFQKSKKAQPAISMLPKMKQAGFGDVVGQRANTYAYDKLRAKRTENANLNSTNHWSRKVSDFSNRPGLIANNIDYVFASNALPVLSWKVCARLNRKRTRLAGVIPSDHFLVRAVVRLV